ncbi:MAG: hypothetical protein WCV50_04295 [Patescibacteria group bacterium]|jgi:hypothetical protein
MAAEANRVSKKWPRILIIFLVTVFYLVVLIGIKHFQSNWLVHSCTTASDCSGDSVCEVNPDDTEMVKTDSDLVSISFRLNPGAHGFCNSYSNTGYFVESNGEVWSGSSDSFRQPPVGYFLIGGYLFALFFIVLFIIFITSFIHFFTKKSELHKEAITPEMQKTLDSDILHYRKRVIRQAVYLALAAAGIAGLALL